ncbi:hypothetical protein V8E51_013653 [Hyaloscypha variabilis]
MRSSLQLDEIQRLIFKSLSPRDLARLVRTCKAFFHVATDELWKTINSFSPFLSCLPPDFQYRYRKLQVPKVQNLFLESRAVMALPPPFRSKPKSKATKYNPEKTWEELWEEITKLRPMSESLSNLRRLHISNVEERLLVPLIGISGSNLTQIHIQFIQNRQTQSSPLKHLRLDLRIRCNMPQYNQSPLPHEILQKSTLKNLTLGLTRDWYTPEITALNNKYLPALQKLWLNLAAFDPGQCKHDKPPYNRKLHRATNCGRRSPAVFFKGLDNPELSLLNIKFPFEVTGRKFLDVVSAANSCRLGNVTELALAGGGCTNLLDILDHKLYRSITAGLPALEELSLGYADFYANYPTYEQGIFYERVLLHHLAAFRGMLPKIKEVSIGTIDGLTLEERPRTEWVCVGVKSLRISHHADVYGEVNLSLLCRGLEIYFPNSGLAKHPLYRKEYMFNREN